jgi:uncharacterized membrane protein HdeD (DUF308 family)
MAHTEEISVGKAFGYMWMALSNKVYDIISFTPSFKQLTMVGMFKVCSTMTGVYLIIKGANLILMDYKFRKTSTI